MVHRDYNYLLNSQEVLHNYISFCTEINPTDDQRQRIEDYFALCIKMYNMYIEYNRVIADTDKTCINPYNYISLLKRNRDTEKIGRKCSLPQYRDAVDKTLHNAEKAIKKYIKGTSNYPLPKNEGTKNISLYFKVHSIDESIQCERHRIQVPYIGWIRLKEKGYIPYKDKDLIIVSGWIKKRAGRYYVSALVNDKRIIFPGAASLPGIGIDLNVSNFATISDGRVIENINKGDSIKKLQKKVKRINREINHKVNTRSKLVEAGVLDKSDLYSGKNLHKARVRLDKTYNKIANIQRDFINKTVYSICKEPYDYIALENLNVTELLSDRRFSKYVSLQDFYTFRLKIHRKCQFTNTEVRIISKWYASSKICHNCGSYFQNLTINDREFTCGKCGALIQRDFNAALNIRDCKDYFVWD